MPSGVFWGEPGKKKKTPKRTRGRRKEFKHEKKKTELAKQTKIKRKNQK